MVGWCPVHSPLLQPVGGGPVVHLLLAGWHFPHLPAKQKLLTCGGGEIESLAFACFVSICTLFALFFSRPIFFAILGVCLPLFTHGVFLDSPPPSARLPQPWRHPSHAEYDAARLALQAQWAALLPALRAAALTPAAADGGAADGGATDGGATDGPEAAARQRAAAVRRDLAQVEAAAGAALRPGLPSRLPRVTVATVATLVRPFPPGRKWCPSHHRCQCHCDCDCDCHHCRWCRWHHLRFHNH